MYFRRCIAHSAAPLSTTQKAAICACATALADLWSGGRGSRAGIMTRKEGKRERKGALREKRWGFLLGVGPVLVSKKVMATYNFETDVLL